MTRPNGSFKHPETSHELPDWRYWYWRGTYPSCKSLACCPRAFHRAACTGLLFVPVLPEKEKAQHNPKETSKGTSKCKRMNSFFTGSAYRSSKECFAIKFFSTAKAKCRISWSSCRAKPTSRSRTPMRKCLRQNSLVSVYSGISWNRMDKNAYINTQDTQPSPISKFSVTFLDLIYCWTLISWSDCPTLLPCLLEYINLMLLFLEIMQFLQFNSKRLFNNKRQFIYTFPWESQMFCT